MAPGPRDPDAVDAEVMWFNTIKSFGFVTLSDGAKVYLHLRVVEAAGTRGVSEGARLKAAVEESPRGLQVSQVLGIGNQIAKLRRFRPRWNSSAGTDAQLESEGTVQWHNPEKGFGFIAPDNGEKDVFVHATALTRSGLSLPAPPRLTP